MNSKNIGILTIILLTTVASGCIATSGGDLKNDTTSKVNNTQNGNNDVREDYGYNVYSDVHSVLESESGRIHVYRDEVRVTGDIVLPETPDDFDESKILDRANVTVETGGNRMGYDAYERNEELCEATVFKENRTFSCSFEPRRGRMIMEVDGKGGGMSFYEVVEGSYYEDQNFYINLTELRVEEDSGWERLIFDLNLKNKNIDESKASNGIGVEFNLITSTGYVSERTGSYNVLEGYSHQDTSSLKYKAKDEPRYLLFKLRGLEKPFIAFNLGDELEE